MKLKLFVENISETAGDKFLLYLYAKISNVAINSCFKVDPLFLYLYHLFSIYLILSPNHETF